MSASVAKVIEVVGASDKSWADAADVAVQAAAESVKDIRGVQVQHMTAEVENGRIVRYKTTVKLAFGVEQG